VRPFRGVARLPVDEPTPPETAFERLYVESFDRVGAYLLARADAGLAADALSRTFEIAWRRIADVPDDPIPWLIGCARNVLSELRRARGRRDGLVERIAAGESHLTVADPADAVVDRVVAVEALAQLDPSERETLLLVAWDGLSARQAAEVVGCTEGAFAVRLSRARARLVAAIELQQPSTDLIEERP